jgi:hypothetical protein
MNSLVLTAIIILSLEYAAYEQGSRTSRMQPKGNFIELARVIGRIGKGQHLVSKR